MRDFFDPMHLFVLGIMVVMLYMIVRSVGPAVIKAALPKPPKLEWVDPSQPQLKHCMQCGEQIASQADSCPFCKRSQSGM